MKHHRARSEAPMRRKYSDGRIRWLARYTNPKTGKRDYARPAWNRGKATFDRKSDAQRAINEAYESADPEGVTVGQYFDTWLDRRPRATRTNDSYRLRFGAVADVPLEGVPLRDWRFTELRRRHSLDLIDAMLRQQGRAAKGATGVLRTLSAMAADAIDDEVIELNPFSGHKIRADDARIQKAPRKPRVWTKEQMHQFAAAAPKDSEALIRMLSDCGLRIGEAFALDASDFDPKERVIRIHQTAHEGRITEGLKGKRSGGGSRTAPVPPGLAELLAARQPRIGLLFPTPRGSVWRYRNFIRDIWDQASAATGLDPSPHDFRHTFVTEMRAAGINDDDLAAITGHTVTTMLTHYSHPLNRSFDAVRDAMG